MTGERNWAGNVEFTASRSSRPQTVGELQEIVSGAHGAGRPFKAIGARHSFSAVADTPGELVSMVDLDRIVDIDHAAMEVTVEAGITYGALGAELHEHGLALANLPSLPHVTVGGAVATGTHGSGSANPCLAAAVRAIDYVGPTGQLNRWSRDVSEFHGAVIALGALGIAAHLTLDVEPTFDVTQVVYRDLPMGDALAHLDEIMGSAYSVSLFTDWQRDVFHQVWVKRRRATGASTPEYHDAWLGLAPFAKPVHMVESLSADSCSAQLGVPGPWHERLPHFRQAFTPSVGDELQAEYFVDRALGGEAIRRIHSIGPELAPLVLVSEIRSVASDELWLSGSYGRDTIAIHFTFVDDEPAVMGALRTIEAAIDDLQPRPHWGKLAAMEPDQVQSRFPRFDDFTALVDAAR
ncbi:MAG: FAD-binding protein [Ilumatobacteraceae bacterium]